MQHPGTIRRLALAAAVAGAAFTAAPAMASAASSCTYNPSNMNVIVTDNSSAEQLQIVRTGDQIRIADGFGARIPCAIPGTSEVATVTNTERIAVFAAPAQVAGGYAVDQVNGAFAPGVTKESDGTSEIEISFDTTGARPKLDVYGTSGHDVMSAGAGGVNLAYDGDADIAWSATPLRVTLHGAGDTDELDGIGGSMLPAAVGPVTLEGDGGNDTLYGHPGFDDILRGGSGDDRMFANDLDLDSVYGGSGKDTATTDLGDTVGGDVETWLIAR